MYLTCTNFYSKIAESVLPSHMTENIKLIWQLNSHNSMIIKVGVPQLHFILHMTLFCKFIPLNFHAADGETQSS